MPEFQVRLGAIRIPFTRDQMEARYSYCVQTNWMYDPQKIFEKIPIPISNSTNININIKKTYFSLANGGMVIHGEVNGGMIRYNVGIFDELNSEKPLKGIDWSARIDFTPTMLGFKPETQTSARGWIHDFYIDKNNNAKDNILTIGIGYMNQDYYPTANSTLSVPFNEVNANGIALDGFLQKKFGVAVTAVELGGAYISHSHYYNKSGKNKKGSTTYWYGQLQVLYDQVVGLGKPAVYFKYEYLTAKAQKDKNMNRVALGLNYYIKGNAARLSTGIDYVSYDNIGPGLEDSLTDFFLQAQVMF